jgi:hypothetical protein
LDRPDEDEGVLLTRNPAVVSGYHKTVAEDLEGPGGKLVFER